MKEKELKNAVREGYARVAKEAGSCCSTGCCGASKPKDIAKKIAPWLHLGVFRLLLQINVDHEQRKNN